MANDSAKKLLATNQALMKKYTAIIVGANALYIAYRVAYLWSTFSGWHIAGYSILLLVYAVCYFMLSRAAAPTYKPLNEGGALVSGGSDLSQGGVLEYTWDMLYTTIFVQLTTGFISDLFWLLYLLPPCIGFYFLWTQVIYPWISKPEEPTEPMAQEKQKAKVKYGKAR